MVGATALWLVLCATSTTAVSVKFHHHLSENDLELYFGTRNSREVPKYDIVHPVRRRHPRTSLIHPPLLQYRLKALGEEYDLHLERNQHLVAPGCLMTHTDGKGGAVVSPCPRGDGDCFYTGTSTLHNSSFVALGTCVGLHGVISTPTHQLLIQPIRGQHLADVNIGRDAGAPHLVYHLTARGMCGVQDTAEQIVPRRVRRQAGGLFLEMLLVADKTMHRYHGDDLVNYMLTAANVAAGRYLDSSLGVPIHLTIISLRVLKDDMDGLNITTDADHTLNSFCQWQEKFNPPGDTDPRHVDAASLMTRENLIHKGVAETTGLASLGGICVKEMRCSILEDNGLDIGLTLAHETGHSLNMQHDSEGNVCDDKTNIMSTGGGGGTTAFKWSSCSKDALHNFLYEGNGACLLDSPTVVGFLLPKDLPGVIYPGDKQCELFLGQGSKICEGTSLVEDYGGDECGKLICFDPHLPGQCTGSQAPRMDGTECGHRKWCINARCADIGPRGPPPRDGGWSEWDSEWSPCSRTCGGGVRIKTRTCDRPRPLFGGKKCEGFDSKAEICNLEPCTAPQSQYREEQCAATDIYPLGGRHLHWLPGDTVGDSVCMLYCSPEGVETIHLRGVGTSTDYKDGTECDSADGGTYNRCVSGKCRAFGCDGVSDSPTRLDVCGICSGSNNTCEKKTGSFFRGKEKSYVTFLTIPRGSTGIKMTNDNRYTWMSIRVNGQRLFNTNLRHKDKKHAYSRDGVKVLYAPYGPESIQIPGPVPTQLQAQVYRLFGYTYSDVSPEIYYEFYQPLVATLPVRYTWTTREGPCSATCGQGSQQVQAVCGRADTGARVERSRCSAEEEPDTQPTPCHQQPCPPRWHTGVFTPCSRSCGGGLASRTVQCMQHQAGQSEVVEDDQCDPASRPLATQTCGSQPCPGAWRTDPWTDCSQTCGVGVRRRGVRCFLTPHTEVPDDNCELSDKPDVNEPCKKAACFIPPVSPCADNISADCQEYDRRVCSRYREWAQHHCPLFCSLCSQTDNVGRRHREGGQEGAAKEQRTDLGGGKAGGQEDGGKGGAEGGRSGGQIGRQEDEEERNTSEETGGEDGGQIEQQEDVTGGQGARQGEDQDVTDQRSQVGDGEGTGDEDGEDRKGVVGGHERAAETVSYSSHPDVRRGYDTTDLVISDDVTQGENDVTQGKDGATQGQDDVTQGEFDVTHGEDGATQGQDDVTQGKDGATQGQDDVTQGEFDVTHGEEVTQAKDDVKQGEDDVTQGTEYGVTQGGANDFTEGEDDVTQGEDDVTRGGNGITQLGAGDEDISEDSDDKGRMLKDQDCVDVLNSCRQYSQRDCRQFPDWAKQNCQRHCNYCDDDYVTTTSSTTSEDLDCSDVNTQCVEYPDSVCEEYESWARTNCKRRCHFCQQDLGQVAATVTPPCVDASIECIDYHQSVCALYKDWAEINCRKFCHVCT
ncbi:A disintegrin and metalloproteinase with thrombospondin motifs 18-like isoform X1 [Haliotis rufescens]|uniref:A disintegrin and metalloproteinase with thrombospondin motifs 18-like isoform X1 n=1 Tax=Haliotis rufescens TaxID=6454 RepID=UPI00201F5973|nr:A disintegrin and metalloproteinase with thrombospondin motifs 18-like isoform X1 [Haliotis rufescens]XP_048245082.1 A disintegrin and metalloproteinase with thrombospondin motifs 18-like isoform X1 [Haliotis rufescens]